MKEIGNGKERGMKRSVVGVIELICSICGTTAKFRTKDEAIDAGWNWFSFRIGKKRRVAAFCPGHSYEVIERWLMKNIFEREGLIKRKGRDGRD